MPRPNEVLVVTPYFSTHHHKYGGNEIGRLTERLIREISGQGTFHFTWIASKCPEDAEPQSEGTIIPLPDLAGQTLLPLPSFNLLDRYFGIPVPFWTRRSLARLATAISQADLVWLHGTEQPCFRAAYKLAKAQGKQIIITQHAGRAAQGSYIRRLLDDLLDRHIRFPMLKNADQAIFVSDRVAEDYFLRGKFERAVSVIPNGVDLQTYHPPLTESRRYVRQKFALKSEQPVLLYVGPMSARKGVLALREMAKLLPNWRFWMAGTGPIDPTKWMLPNIHVFRDKKTQTLAELYQGADVLLMPGAGSNFPRAIQEAMACGLPVLCGPLTAEGSRTAVPFMHLAHVWPEDNVRTAKDWVAYLLDFPLALPRVTPDEDVAEFAMKSWDWPPIAEVHASIFNALRRKAGRS